MKEIKEMKEKSLITENVISEKKIKKTSSFKGHKHTEESKKQISQSMMGHPVSDATKTKMSVSRKLYLQKKKEEGNK